MMWEVKGVKKIANRWGCEEIKNGNASPPLLHVLQKR
jgi:hypothetical protein